MLKNTSTDWPSPIFEATFAPAGTGKRSADPPIVIIRPALAGADAAAATDALRAGADALRAGAGALVEGALVDGVLVAGRVTVVIPAVHAATAKLTAQAAAASAAER
jgi:hypothetical protein